MRDRNDGLFSRPRREIYHTARIKKYPGGGFEVMACSRPIFRESGWEEPDRDERSEERRRRRAEDQDLRDLGWLPEEEPEAPTEGSADRAARRAAAKVRDLALCNGFSWFVTLTLDPDKVDRYDIREITKKLNRWLDNHVRRDGLRYVLVPERHKDGAVHFHGFINEQPGLVPSGTWKVPGHKKPIKPRSAAQRREWAAQGDEKGFHEVYNWERWPLGFSTAIKLYGSYPAAVAYVCKYIRKQVDGGKIGGRWYYSGGDLRRPEVELCDLGYDQIASDEGSHLFTVPEARLAFAMLRGFDEGGEAERPAAEAGGVGGAGGKNESLQKPESKPAPEGGAPTGAAGPAGAGSTGKKRKED